MNGIILVNKEKEYTSNDIVQIAKHTLKEKTGHIGTLDPNATGILPILIGKGTKISKYLINHDKIYEVILKLGIKTETADSDGKIIEKKNVPEEIMEIELIQKTLKSFIGKQQQIPPKYSAIKINGKKLYDYARAGEEIEIKPREIEIYDIELKEIDKNNNQINFMVKCSKGTYIRSLCEDIATKLGTIGHMKELNRIQVGEFNVDSAVKIEDIRSKKDDKLFLNEHVISIEKIISSFEKIQINQKDMNKFLNGVKIEKNLSDNIYRIYNYKNEFIGTGIIKDKILKRDVII